MPRECEICATARTSLSACGTCGLCACRACARRCVLENARALQCARCAREWDLEEAHARVGRAFVATQYRRLRRTQLLAREQGRLADTEQLARHVRTERALRTEARALTVRVRDGEWEAIPDLRRVQVALYRHRLGRHGQVDAPRGAWLARCAHHGCDGRTGEDGVCGACARITCRGCGADGTPPHVCDPAAVASVDAIRASCRPCVRCQAPSTRVEGCPTMWCVRCQTFWNWDTGRVIDSARMLPHNPDHRQWLREGGQARAMREVGDLPCGGLPDGTMLHTAMLREMMASLDVAPSTLIVVEAAEALHAAQALRDNYPRTWIDADVHEEARVAHLNGELDEDAFAQTLERTERTCQLRREVGLILETLVLAGADVLQRLCEAGLGVEAAAIELQELRELTDAALARVSRVHLRTVPRITPRWRWALPRQRRVAAPAV